MKLSELEFYLKDFLAFCQQKNLSKKTLSSYEQSLKLFVVYLKKEQGIDTLADVKTGHIRQYISYVQERGKYTVVSCEDTTKINFPHNRTDYKKKVSTVTINNYTRNIKVFFNWLKKEGELRHTDSPLLFLTTRGTKIGIPSFEKQLKDAGKRIGRLDVHSHQ
ncbi:site-specific integrase [Paenibacillus profundus]|uniref:site-specific integrase n=1 Tax=Paenibacillus profundus TaxID=1173085 RepID=UPI003898E8CA